jgi:hypothetical protein
VTGKYQSFTKETIMGISRTALILAFAFQPFLGGALPTPSPPGIPSTSDARTQLAGLTVAPQGSQDGYDREKFPHWITISG